MNKKLPFAIVADKHTSLNNKTGSWRSVRPEYVDRIPPCNLTCPAGEDIQGWLSAATEGNFSKAWEIMVENNPFPAIMGRICYHSCEKVCNRTQFDGAVNINLLERSIGDMAIQNKWNFVKPFEKKIPTNKKVLIIGAGPSGLTAAYFLAKKGHDVTIYEAHIKTGGMMRYGVPRYRLPDTIINAEIKRIIDLGVKIICNKRVQNIQNEKDKFDAIYIATGAHVAQKSDIKIKDNANYIDAIDLFKKIEDFPIEMPKIGKQVLVYGGGNTAIDAARTALRLGAENVKIVYRRTINNMPAHDVEIQEALSEGVELLCLRTIESIEKGKVVLNKMEYNSELETLNKTGEIEVLEADYVILAIGQSIDETITKDIPEIQISETSGIIVDKDFMTNVAGIFAGGDVTSKRRTVTNAIGFGKKAAKNIDAYLNGEKIVKKPKTESINFKKLNTSYYETEERKEISRLGDISFDEKDISYKKKEIILESSRCFSCGNCFHCDNCYGYCPDNAITKNEDGTLKINYDYCKGCGICATECPCGSIKMVSNEDE